MERLKTIEINPKQKYKTIGLPQNWLEEWFPIGGELEVYQDKDRLILTPKKSKEKAGCK